MKISSLAIKLMVFFSIYAHSISLYAHSISLYGYHAAGVLPYAIDQSGKFKILLGSSSVHANQASDFGGLRDAIDNDNPQVTAAREACEELMFILDSNEEFRRILSLRNKYKKHFDISKAKSSSYEFLIKKMTDGCFSVKSQGYIMHFVEIPYDETIIRNFDIRKSTYHSKVPKCWRETVALTWVDLEELLHAIDTTTATYDDVVIHGVTLYNPFVQSFKKACKKSVAALLS